MKSLLIWAALGVLASLNLGCGSDGGTPSGETSGIQNAGSVGGAGGSPVACEGGSDGKVAAKPPDSASAYRFEKGLQCLTTAPGDYHPQWAHGPANQLNWMDLKDDSKENQDLILKSNTKYVITYDSDGELSISRSQDCSLDGSAKLCVENSQNEDVRMRFCLDSRLYSSPDPQTSGIYPDYYGPYAPAPVGESWNCEDMSSPGNFYVLWAHGPQEQWQWKYLDSPLDMKANMRFFLSYDGNGKELVAESKFDRCLGGKTSLCTNNNGQDELAISLEPNSDH